MDSEKIIGVLELGTIYLKSMIVQLSDDNELEILGTSYVQSKGIHNGVIINLADATNSIRNSLADVEKKSKVSLKKINIVFEPKEFLCTRISKYKKIGGSKIQEDDISYLLREAKNQVKVNDINQDIIHIFNYNYVIDFKKFDSEPINMYAHFMQHETTIITTPKNILRNINQCLINCDIEIEKFISRTFALGVACLTSTDLRLGSAVIDIGYERTSIGIFNNTALTHSTTFPIGINHVTKDISRVCSISINDSENIKNNLNLIYEKNNKNHLDDGDNHLAEHFFIESKFRKISVSLIESVVKARLEDIFTLIKKEIICSDLQLTVGKNILITGGGSNLSNIDKFCSHFFGCNVKKLNIPASLNFLEDKSENFNSCFGAVKLISNGFETEAIAHEKSKNKVKFDIFAKLFGEKD